MPYVANLGRVAGAAALALGLTANSNAAGLEWTDSILDNPSVVSRSFSIESLTQQRVSLFDNAFLANFDFLSVLISRTGGATAATLLAPGTTTFTPTAIGSYTATVFGDPGALGARSVSTFGVTVAAVPEPETWAMMLVGMGLVGWQLRRKAKASGATRLV